MLPTLLSLALCSQVVTVRYWVDADLPGHTREDVHAVAVEAAASWARVANVRIVPASSKATANLRIVPFYSGWNGMTTIGSPTYYRSGQSATMQLSRSMRMSRRSLLSVVTHEMGHALGLQHGPWGTVMAPDTRDRVTLHQSDVQAVVRIYGPLPLPPVVVVEKRPRNREDDPWPVAPDFPGDWVVPPMAPSSYPAPPPPDVSLGGRM